MIKSNDNAKIENLITILQTLLSKAFLNEKLTTLDQTYKCALESFMNDILSTLYSPEFWVSEELALQLTQLFVIFIQSPNSY